MMIEHSRRIQRGFSLHEAMISLAVLSSGLLALAQFQGQIHENSGQTKAQTAAVNLAQQKLEALRDQASIDYAGIAEGRDTPSMQAGDNTRFSRRWTVTHHASPDYKAVSVTTDWQSVDGTTQSVNIASFLVPGIPYRSQLSTEPEAVSETGGQDESSDQDRKSPDDAGRTQQAETPVADRETAEIKPPATCLCQRRDEGGRLDDRNSHPDCTDDCCQSAWQNSAKDLCQQDDCTFVAQCLAS